ncbi:MAG: bifunctional DNA primase/polymerase [Gemmatimonadaceae bacterium]|nr:bifunctional DNA primase/polymerase [Phycisphaerae bacterium]NUQ10806.1 bifunctional DNA primase/polymerase [Gemmatimonadaceae bacterium]
MAELLERALDYREAGLCVLPAIRDEKRPALPTWKQYQHRLPTPQELATWFRNGSAACLIAGAVSGNLEMIDFDLGGESFEPWADIVRQRAPGLLERLVVEQSQSGGRHVVYRCSGRVNGNLKLAQRAVEAPDDRPVVLHGKSYQPRRCTDRWLVIVTLIETRGEGGLFLCAPSPGYELIQGEFTALPVLTEYERLTLLDAAWSLNEWVERVESPQNGRVAGDRPGDEYNRRNDPREVLCRHGWALVREGENEYWRRPGKTDGYSATLKDGVFYVFTSNAPPFEPNRAYAPFAVYALLEHDGDFAAAAIALRSQGFGDNGDAPDGGVDLSALTGSDPDLREPTAPPLPDPGPLPDELLRVPGFVGEVMDYCLATAPYPNPVMAFCGALAIQAFLAGRRVRDPADNRTNIYLLGLAHSAAGKDHPRKVNTRIAHEVGVAEYIGDRFASGEGVQDALFVNPCMLFQTDEIDGMLQSINKAKDARHENVMSTLLTMYSASNSVFPMRRKAGKPSPGVIDQPNLVIFGTAIPNHYYEALSERMLTNGFFARMVILESGPRTSGQEPRIAALPPRVIETAHWWADFRPGRGNLQDWHPAPAIVEATDDAMTLLVETRKEAEAEYSKAEAGSDPVGTTVWGRVSEQVRKLALLYAISESHRAPRIGLEAVEWASRFVLHQTRRMLFMASSHVADSEFDADCLKVIGKLRASPNLTLSHSKLLKRMKRKSTELDEIMKTLILRGDVEPVSDQRTGPGPKAVSYRLRVNGSGEE